MRLILLDTDTPYRRNFYPIALSRPIWSLRCGMTTLGQKLRDAVGTNDVAGFAPEWMAPSHRARSDMPLNDAAALRGADLLLVDARVRADGLNVAASGPSEVGLGADGTCQYARIAQADLAGLDTRSVEALVASASERCPKVTSDLPAWQYIWDLVLANPDQITADFAAAGRHGVEGTVEQPHALRGSARDVYIAPGVSIHPMVVIDAEHGPVYIDADVEVHPFTRIEGPCYVGPRSTLLGAKCREGNSIGPVCRIGGEVEESIIHGYSNKYHDGFLGHAYVGEWVNLGAVTTNSDLKNDYGHVEVTLDGRTPINTGSTKVGSLIGDHTKTSIGTLLNTGAYVGAMSLIMATGKPLPKYIPEFAWLLNGIVTKGFGRKKLYETAATAMGRRKLEWTEADVAMWDKVFELTAPQRSEMVRRGRQQISRKQ